MRKTTWNITVGLVCALAASFAFAQTGQGQQPETPEPPANGATRVNSPLASDPVRSWQDSTRGRAQTEGRDGTSGPRTTPPANGRNGAANSQVTLPNCTDSNAANFGSIGNCIYLPPPVVPPPPPSTCTGSASESRSVGRSCPSGFGGYTEFQERTRSCNSGNWSAWSGWNWISDTSNSCPGGPPPPPTCTDPAATNFGGALPCQYPARCTDPAATNFNQIGSCVYGCTGASSENRTTSGVSCPAPTTGTYTVTTLFTRSCNSGVWSAWQSGGQVASTQSSDCVSPPTTCQDPTALNFGGPLPCIARPINVCDVNPGSADCCLANPGHASCGRFTCESNGGAWSGGVCNYGMCGMPPLWDPCVHHGGVIDVQPGGVRCANGIWFWCP